VGKVGQFSVQLNTKANTQFGKGGAVQYYVAESDFNKLTMGKIRKI
jgi:hypothetical protein